MSYHLVNLAWEVDMPHTRKIVLLALAHFAMQSTGECYPSTRMLAARCGLSQSAVRTSLIHLENNGFVEKPPMPEGAPIVYRVNLVRPA